MRNPDDPTIKDSIMAHLSGGVIEYLKSIGLNSGSDFIMKTIPKFQCSTRVIFIDGVHNSKQIVVAFHSIGMDVEYGISYKGDVPQGKEKVLRRDKIESLRYNISEGTEPTLTDGSQQKYDEMLKEIKVEIETLINEKQLSPVN